MAETDKSQVAGEAREPGFYWVRTWSPRSPGNGQECVWELGAPQVAEFRPAAYGGGGDWLLAGSEQTEPDNEPYRAVVLSPRLEPPK